MRLSGTRLLTRLAVVERNLASIPATTTLERIAAGRRPVELLPLIPLFQGADDPAIISEWKRLAEQQTDENLRQALPLMLYFAEAAGRLDMWRPALEGFNVIESQVLKEWNDLARQEGIKEGKVESILLLLRQKGAVPADLEQAISALKDPARLSAVLLTAVSSATIDDFRRTTGL
jgi:hypothetical protein